MRASSVAVWGAFLALFSLALVARHVLKSWLAPGAFFALYWCAASFIPFLVLPDDEISAEAVLWILLAALAVFVGNFLATKGKIYSSTRSSPYSLSRSQISITKVMVLVSLILGLGAVLSALRDAGYGLSSLFSLGSLVAMANWFSEGRYFGTYSPPLLSQLLLIFVYTGPMFAGFLTATSSRKKLWVLSVLSLLPAVLIMVIRTQRGVLVTAGAFWFSAYLATNCLHGHLALFTRQRVLLGVLAVPLTILVFALVALARAGSTDTTLLPLLFRKVMSGATGHIIAFSTWFEEEGLRVKHPLLGKVTFASVYNALGIYERELGLFQEFILLETGFTTNVYTFFRPLIHDFTVFGTLSLLFGVGFLSGIAYQHSLVGRLRSVPVLTAFYATVIYSAMTSVWVWSTVLLGFLVYAFALWLLPFLSSKRLPVRSHRMLFRGRSASKL